MGGEIGGEGILGVLCLPSLYVRLCRIRSRRVSVVVVVVIVNRNRNRRRRVSVLKLVNGIFFWQQGFDIRFEYV